MKITGRLLLFGFLMAVFSCEEKSAIKTKLIHIDSIADVAPQTALAMLDSIEPDNGDASEAEKNYASLIRIKANDKAYITHKSDTDIVKVVDYFENKGYKKIMPAAYYYAGRVYSDMNDAPRALDYFLKAENAAKENGCNSRLLSRIFSQSGHILYYRGFYKVALGKFMQAQSLYERDADTVNLVYNLRETGRVYWNLEQLDSALFYYKRALQLAEKTGKNEVVTNTREQLAAFYLYNEKTEEAKKLLMQDCSNIDSVDISSILSIYSDFYLQTNNIDSAVICYKKLLQYGNVYGKQGAYEGLLKYYLSIGENDKARECLDAYIMLADSIKDLNAAAELAKSLSMYNYELREKENNSLKLENQREKAFSVVFSTACFALFILALLFYSKYKHKTDVMRFKDEKLILLNNEIEKQRQKEHSKNNTDDALLSSDIYKILLKRIDSWPETQKSLTDEEWEKLDETINNAYPKFRQNVYAVYPTTEYEYHVCLLIKARVSPVNIGRMTNHSKESITSTRRRLFEKAFNKKGSPSDWDKVIALL